MGAVGVGELPDQPRLADARLADQRHDLAVAAARPAERPAERLQLGVPAHEPGQPARGRRLEAASGRRRRRPARRPRPAASRPLTGIGPERPSPAT